MTVERKQRERTTPWIETSGNQVLIDVLRSWGVSFFAGVNGGGVVHVAKHLEPYTDLSQSRDGVSRMLTMGEYVAGFAPLGHCTRRAASRAASRRPAPRRSSAAAA